MTRRGPRRCALLLLTLTGLMLPAGCGDADAPGFDQFRRQWHDAVNNREYEKLYDLLDNASKRQLAVELERLRGLSPQEQQVVIDWLGGERVESLTELTPRQYFARLWHLALEGQRPTMSIEAAGGDNAYMILGLDDRTQRVRLFREGGQWVWSLTLPSGARLLDQPPTFEQT